MQRITVIPLKLGPLEVNTYILICRASGASVIIDPAGAPERIIDTLHREKSSPRLILNTHGHPDHVLANAAIRAALGIPAAMHGADSGRYAEAAEVATLENQTGLTVDTVADQLIEDDQRIPVGEMELRVLHTPGHSPGSCCFLVAGHLFTGDTLLIGDVGRTDLPGGAFDRLIRSIAEKLVDLPDDTLIWPGHDYHLDAPPEDRPVGPATLGREKRENPYITDFIRETYSSTGK